MTAEAAMDDAIGTLIRRKLRDGRLPLGNLSRVWRGRSEDDVCCAVCDEPITKQQIVLEGIVSLSDKPPKPIHFHIRCFELWTHAVAGRTGQCTKVFGGPA
jgi:hypothetical protein